MRYFNGSSDCVGENHNSLWNRLHAPLQDWFVHSRDTNMESSNSPNIAGPKALAEMLACMHAGNSAPDLARLFMNAGAGMPLLCPAVETPGA